MSNPAPAIQGAALRAFATPESQARPGNSNGLKHGAYASGKSVLRLRARAVRRLVDQLYVACPWLGPTDVQTARKWAEVVKVGASLFAALEVAGPYNTSGGDVIPRRILSEYRQLAALELQLATALGLTPVARATLGVDIARGRAYDAASEIARAKSADKNGHATATVEAGKGT